MTFNEILEKRRAINFFDPDRDVSDEEIRAIIEDAAKSPSSFNLQPWKLKVVRNPERKAALRAVAWDQPKVSEAPVVFIVLGDREGWREGCPTLEGHFKNNLVPEQRDWFINATSGLYGKNAETALAFANKNAGLFAMSLMYAASARGLHTHPMDGFDMDGVRKEFNIPDNFWIPMIIAVGHLKPGVEIAPKAWRQSVDDIILD